MMKKISNFIKTRKILSAIILVLVIGAGYYIYKLINPTVTLSSYVVTKAKIGNIVTTVSGTGQVYASSQLDIKSKSSGSLVYLNTQANGQQIKKGTLIAQVDTRDALISLESAKISYAKLVQPADAPTITQAQNNLSDAILSNTKSYSDGFNSIVTTFIDLPTIMNGLNDMIYSKTGYLQTENVRSVGQTALDLQTKAGVSYDTAKNHYDAILISYKNLSSASPTSSIESFVSDTYTLAKEISGVVKNAQNAINYVRNQKNDSAGSTAENTVASWTNTITSDTTSLLSAKNTIISSAQNIVQQNLNLQKTQRGATDLDIAAQKLQLEQAQNTYDDYFIRAPFDGLLARLSVKSTDVISSGATIGTIVSTQKVADITLNEVDVAKVKVGQKVKLTFDAVSGLTMDGTVVTVDSVGTVTQGVVNYNVEIALDNIDDRIKSGMSVSATITVDTKENVLTVPNSAIKTMGKFTSVEVFDPPIVATKGTTGTPSAVAPVQKRVQIGVSNDTLTEIISGIAENDQVVTRTISGTSATTAAKPATSLLGGGGGGSGVRIPRGN